MLQIDRAILSFDVLEKEFICDLEKCKGACCVAGSSGAPLLDEETKTLENIYPIVKKYIPESGVKAIEKQGVFVIDSDGDKVTSLVNNNECVFAYFENNIIKCAIEKAWLNKEIDFQKPLSCHLYPIRITRYANHDAVNYESIDICKPATCLGSEKKVKVYQFLKDPLIRAYGKEWYEQLCYAAQYMPVRPGGKKR